MASRKPNNMIGATGAGGNSSAPATYSGARNDNDLVDEIVDERILRLLGLEDIFDIDYGTYKTLLKERLASARMTNSQIPADEDELIRDEFKRIKSKEGRFKVKKKKITAENIGFKKPSSAIAKYQNIPALSKDLVKPKAEEKGAEEKPKVEKVDKGLGDSLKSINDTLGKILKSILSQNSSDRKRREKERTAGEKRKSQERESGLEKPLQIVKNLAKKIIQPFQGILDKVFRFLTFTFLGWLVGKYDEIQKLIDNNRGKINTVVRFLKDWWPALLGAYVLFATPFGKLIRSTLSLIARFSVSIVRFLASHPLIAAGAAAGLATFAAYQWKQKEDKKLVDAEAKKRDVKPEVVQKELEQSKRSPLGMIGEAFSSIGPMGYVGGGTIPIRGFSGGGNLNLGKYFSGIVSKDKANYVSGYGKDTQMFPIEGGGSAVLQPGETVLQVGARERMIREEGVDPLAYNVGPSANKPTKFTYKNGGTVSGMYGGGIVGMQGGGSYADYQTQVQLLRAGLKGAALPSQGIRGKGLGGQLRKGYHGTSKAAAQSIRQANLYGDWQKRGLGFRYGSPQNYYFTKNAFFSPDIGVAQRFATEAATEKRGILDRALNRGVRGTGEILDVAAPMGSGSFLRIPSVTEQVVKPQTLTKGMRLMEKINQGKYAKSAKAQQLMTKGYTTASLKGARALGKTAGRFIPFAGLGLSAADAAMRFKEGDLAGGGMSLLSMIPGPLGWVAMGGQALYDMARSNPKSAQYRPGGGRQAANAKKSTIVANASRPNYKPGGGRQEANARRSVVRRRGGGIVDKLGQGIRNIVGGVGNMLFPTRKAKATETKVKIPVPDYMTPQASALLKTIRTAEHYKGRDPYTSIYGGGSAPLTKMTVQEIIDMGNSGRLPKRFGGQSAGYESGSAATGAYQFMPFTLQDLVRRKLVKPNQIMTPDLQDRLGWELAANRGISVGSLKKSGLTQSLMDKMAPEWASFPYSGKGGASYYGQPVKGADFLRQIYQKSLTRKQDGGPVSGGVLKIGTTFGGASGTKQSRWLEGSVTGGSKTTQGNASAKLGYGATYEPTSAEDAVTNALNSLISGTANSQKPTMREGLMGSFMANLNTFYSGSPTEKPKVTTPEESSKPSRQSTTPTSTGQQTASPPGPPVPSEAEKEAYRKDVMDSATYGPGYYEKAGDSYDPSKVAFATEARDRDKRISDYHAKYLSTGVEKPTMKSDGIYGFKKGGAARFMKAGRVTTTTGTDASAVGMSGMFGADTQLTPPMALQPGEDLYVVPRQAVPQMDSMVANLDRNSNPAKIQSNLSKPLGPKITYINLPNKVINSKSSDNGVGRAPSPNVPMFSVTMQSSKRTEVATALGIQDLI